MIMIMIILMILLMIIVLTIIVLMMTIMMMIIIIVIKEHGVSWESHADPRQRSGGHARQTGGPQVVAAAYVYLEICIKHIYREREIFDKHEYIIYIYIYNDKHINNMIQ